ncbi:unnamed protein product [Caenorhabditis auriculariae]|uniref:guanylate cyclase n=1 Tax=Caenorhabditis auriculariae TaxID=2777116 RepID=A0A8S1HIS9_9PELO|nr:unnamed protein product [Caenorhabditis auriculariae]
MRRLGYCAIKVLETFRWNKVALFSVDDEMNLCSTIIDDVEPMVDLLMIIPCGVSLSGEVTINQNNTRMPLFVFYGLNSKYDQVSYMNVTYFSSVAAKITDYGLDQLLEEAVPTKKRQLWLAPEVLRNNTPRSQIEKSGDIFSFAIVCSEILTRKSAWDISNRKEREFYL